MDYSDLFFACKEVIQSLEQQPYGSHADEIETSMMLYIAPKTVRMDKAVPELSLNQPGGLTRVPPSSDQPSKGSSFH